MSIELKSGDTIEGIVLGKSLNCLIVRDNNQVYKLVSKYALVKPEEFNFKDDFAGCKESCTDAAL